jgi:guanylate kinase
MSSKSPLLFIVSSPSGAGKTTLTNRLMQRIEGLSFSVSHTTRRPRNNEQDGREYHFVSRDQFVSLIESGAFLEWADVHGNLYGTSRTELDRSGSRRGIIFDVDYQGARQIKSHLPDSISVFILPPDMETLHARLAGRASEDAATVAKRFSVALTEIAHYGLFDYLLVNDDVEVATTRLVSILLAEECRRCRAAPVAERLLADSLGYGGKRPPGTF